MHVVRSDGNVLYMSEQEFSPDWDEYPKHVESVIWDFTKRPTFRSLLEAHGKASGLRGYAILEAHGIAHPESHPPDWLFEDGGDRVKMQDWVDEIDGSKLAILLYLCNMGGYDYALTSERSILIHPKGRVSVQEVAGRGHMRLSFPGKGYLEGDYPKIRKVLAGLADGAPGKTY